MDDDGDAYTVLQAHAVSSLCFGQTHTSFLCGQTHLLRNIVRRSSGTGGKHAKDDQEDDDSSITMLAMEAGAPCSPSSSRSSGPPHAAPPRGQLR